MLPSPTRPKIGCTTARLAIVLLFAFALAPLSCAPALARDGAGAMQIEAGSGQVLHLRGRATSVFAADPKVAEVRPASANSLFVFGVAPGHTTVAALSADGTAVGTYDISVVPSGFDARRIGGSIRTALPQSGLSVEQDASGVTLSGVADTPADDARAVAIATDEIGKNGTVQNQSSVVGAVQVTLRVRIAEMSRNITRELGINWQSVNSLGQQAAFGITTGNALATLSSLQSAIGFQSKFNFNGTVTLDTVIDALSQDQLVRMLAEPNLTTMSGEPASFLVGGEFPIPVASDNNTVTVSFKQYGISLAFVPTVLSNGQINLHVRPEVSQLTTQGAVSIGAGNANIQIPGLTVRRADTTVELGSGQSFAIAGLLEDNATTTGLGLPFLGDIPILGALFRSSSFQQQQTELVIVVTPYIVRPVSDTSVLVLPTDANRPPNDLERILLLRQVARQATASGRQAAALPSTDHGHIPGDAGFLVE